MSSEKQTEYQKDTSTESPIQTYSRRDFFKIAGILGATTALTSAPTGLVKKVLASPNRPPSEQAQIDFYSTDEAINHIFGKLEMPEYGILIKEKKEASSQEIEDNQKYIEAIRDFAEGLEIPIKNQLALEKPIQKSKDIDYLNRRGEKEFLSGYSQFYSEEISNVSFIIQMFKAINEAWFKEYIGFKIQNQNYVFVDYRGARLKGLIQKRLEKELNKPFIETFYRDRQKKYPEIEELQGKTNPKEVLEILKRFTKPASEFFKD